MPFSGGTHSLTNNFTTEAAAPPIEIAKLDTTLEDISDSLSSCVLRDGTGLPTADLNMNAQKVVNAAAATTLTGLPRVTEIIDQDHIYYVDSGAVDVYVITPSPAIAAYEEGQRFVWRATHTNTTTSTLNVNSLGAIVIQTNDGGALAAGAIANGGIYEVTYDANTTPDRWVLTSPSSKLPDGMLSSNVPLKNAANEFTVGQVIRLDAAILTFKNAAGSTLGYVNFNNADDTYFVTQTARAQRFFTNNVERFAIASDGNYDFKTGSVSTSGLSAAEVGTHGIVQNSQSVDYTAVIGDRDKSLHQTGASKTFTIPANSSVAYPIGTTLTFTVDNATGVSIAITSDTLRLAGSATTGTRTLAQYGMATALKILSTTWLISGAGLG